MRHTLCRLLSAALIFVMTACGGPERGETVSNRQDASSTSQDFSISIPTVLPEDTDKRPSAEESGETAITITVGEQTFSATLFDNETAHELAAMLPLTLDMSELNGNEKFFYLDSSLPTDSQAPGQINAGDLMLYGNNCLVVFYESFSSGYSYTRLGRVTDPLGLADALGKSEVTVTFAMGE